MNFHLKRLWKHFGFLSTDYLICVFLNVDLCHFPQGSSTRYFHNSCPAAEFLKPGSPGSYGHAERPARGLEAGPW